MNSYYKEILTKRFQTTMIGSLYEFEKIFGYLWGHEKNEEDLTNSELEFLDRWEETRNNILNNGNHQLRKAISDFDKSEGQTKYTYKFYKSQERDHKHEN
ncbi:MAG: hypothetical protein EBZ62_00035 [Sphingobacteriia bacterium]|jgi:hypothetical protein|nr:hypothetical protein [Sphingobacteriia bacterium]